MSQPGMFILLLFLAAVGIGWLIRRRILGRSSLTDRVQSLDESYGKIAEQDAATGKAGDALTQRRH